MEGCLSHLSRDLEDDETGATSFTGEFRVSPLLSRERDRETRLFGFHPISKTFQLPAWMVLWQGWGW